MRHETAASVRAGSVDGPPRLVVLLSMTPNADVFAAMASLAALSDDAAQFTVRPGPQTLRYASLKGRLTLLPVDRVLDDVLDACKVADIVLIVGQAEENWDEHGELFASLILAQGQPTVVGLVQGLANLKPKLAGEAKKARAQYLQTRFGDEPKSIYLDSPEQATLAVRTLLTTKLRPIHWRDGRPYALIDAVAPAPDTPNGVLLRGYVRGDAITASQLVHLPRLGTYALRRISVLPDPYSLRVRRAGADVPSDLPSQLADPDKQFSLQTYAEPEEGSVDLGRVDDFDEDDGAGDEGSASGHGARSSAARMDGALAPPVIHEGTGIELVDGRELNRERPRLDRSGLPHGGVRLPVVRADTHQAWDEFLALAPETEDGEAPERMGDDDDGAASADGDGGAGRAVPSTVGGDSDDGLDAAEYDARYGDNEDGAASTDGHAGKSEQELLAERMAEDATWPDEVYMPRGPLARDLFRGYRGLKSFHDSPWNRYENLPSDYSRIIELGNGVGKVWQEDVDEVFTLGLAADEYFELELVDVPAEFLQVLAASPASPLVCFGQLRHEQDYSVLHFDVMRHASCDLALESGTPLLVHLGFRRLLAAPILSSSNPKADKNKLERFWQPNKGLVASIYGPCTFGQMPVLLFAPGRVEGEAARLVATGRLQSIRPETLIIKRVVLIGEPMKMRKKRATVRRLFYDADDIKYFKKVELRTKYGRHGHIICPLGTHGHAKCQFDGTLDPRDTVCLSLYTRVFPRWGTEILSCTSDVQGFMERMALKRGAHADGEDGRAGLDMALL